MDPSTYIDPYLTQYDRLVLDRLLDDAQVGVEEDDRKAKGSESDSEEVDSGYASAASSPSEDGEQSKGLRHRKPIATIGTDATTIETLRALNDPKSSTFEPTVSLFWDLPDIKLPSPIDRYIFQPYVRWARQVARHESDVVMITHLLLYFTTTVPSAIYLFHNFTWLHGVLHWIMQSYYTGTYTLMMHQHIHSRGILSKSKDSPLTRAFDAAFPYITDPLFGHTWNTYYFHHVKHHHVEGNGPDDISSTIRYQRDDPLHFAIYVTRFLAFVWVDLPLAFIRRSQWKLAAKVAASEWGTYLMYYLCFTYLDARATTFVFLLPFALLRLGLMVGNWGQHCFVDEVSPESDFRSSITLIDVASNRFCFNDGYHTSHHLNPLRHWRDHPVAFLKQKDTYAKEQALVFRNIDYLMITFRVLRKDYDYLARCLVPIGSQIGMSQAELAQMLETKTRRFTEEEIKEKFGKSG